jgi:hypothetical protein
MHQEGFRDMAEQSGSRLEHSEAHQERMRPSDRVDLPK